MLRQLQQLLISLGIIAVALVAGLIAAGVIDPTSPISSNVPSARGSAGPTDAPGTAESPTPEPRPTRSPDPGEVAVLVGAGDIADCDRFQDELTADLLETIAGTVMMIGDGADPDGSLQTYRDCYGPTWGRPGIKERTRPVPGDNDYETRGAAGYFEWFGDAAGEPSSGYYAFDAGTWRVYALNGECSRIGGCGPGSPEEGWLQEDLAANPRDCVVALVHRPYFTSGPSGGGNSSMRNLWRVLQEAGAELMLSGHDHHYERFEPQTGAGEVDPDGIVQFVVGTGGSRPDDPEIEAPHSIVAAAGVYGVLRLELQPGGYEFRFISVAGPDFSDTGSGECH